MDNKKKSVNFTCKLNRIRVNIQEQRGKIALSGKQNNYAVIF